MKKIHLSAILSLCFLFCASAFGQSNSTIGGTVQDATGALIPGVEVTATNTGTGIVNSTITNETGSYQFPSLQPGSYKLQAELAGFEKTVVNNYALGGSAQATVNFTLRVGSTNSVLDVTISADAALATSSNSIGTVHYTQIADPYVSSVTPAQGLNTAFSNKAIADSNGNVVLVNPQPGQVGSLGLTTIRGPRILNFDMNMIKRFPIRENMNFEFRIDAINILNHPNFADPVTNIDATGASGFGRITSATGVRQFIVSTRVNF